MAILNVYKNNPTAGGVDGAKVVAGNPILTPYLDLAQNESVDIKLALRCDSGKKTLGQTTITPTAPSVALATAAPAGSRDITVLTATKLQAGNLLEFGTGETKEVVRVVLITGTTLTLAEPTEFSHASGESGFSLSKKRIALANAVDGAAGNFGEYGAALILPYLATPRNVVAATANVGGALSPGSYSYRVSAYNVTGETLACVAVGIVVPSGTSTNTVTLTWGAVSGATGYRVYGRTAAVEYFMGNTVQATFTDTGANTPEGEPPVTSPVQVTDKNTIFYARIGTAEEEVVPYKDATGQLTVTAVVGDASE